MTGAYHWRIVIAHHPLAEGPEKGRQQTVFHVTRDPDAQGRALRRAERLGLLGAWMSACEPLPDPQSPEEQAKRALGRARISLRALTAAERWGSDRS